jgi:hypothetical protein
MARSGTPVVPSIGQRILRATSALGIDWRFWASMPMDVAGVSLSSHDGTVMYTCARPEFPAGVCVTCGCTAHDPCFYGPNMPDYDGSTCGWVDPSDPRQCTFCGGVDPFGSSLQPTCRHGVPLDWNCNACSDTGARRR